MLVVVSIIITLGLVGFVALGWYYARQLTHPTRQLTPQAPADFGLLAERVEFPAQDGVCLRGWWIPATHARGTLILCHGYSGDCSPDFEYGAWLTSAGYNLLYFDNRAHGLSDGRLTTLGYLETRDLLGAIDFLRGRGITRVGVLGFSMGGSVALQTAPLTEAIRCVVADCTYADLRRLLIYQAPQTRVPPWLAPLAATVVMVCASIQARCNLFAHSPEKSIGRIAPRPVLLIQAGNDELIPPGETARLYAAAREPKELWCVEGASHRAVDKLKEIEPEYKRRLIAFFDQYLADKLIMASDRFTPKAAPPSELGMSCAAE